MIKAPSLSLDRVHLGGLLGVVVLSVLAGAAMLGPLAQGHRANKQERVRLTESRKRLEMCLSQAGHLRTAMDNARAELTAGQVALLPATRINGRISDLTDLAARQHLDVQRIQPGQAVLAGPHEQVPIRLIATGRYPSCAGFIHQLRQRLPDVSVESLSVRRQGTGGETVTEMCVDLVWFAEPSSAETGAPVAVAAKP